MLEDRRDHADRVDVRFARLVQLRVALRDEEDPLVRARRAHAGGDATEAGRPTTNADFIRGKTTMSRSGTTGRTFECVIRS